MKVTQEKLPASRLGLEIEIPSESTSQAYEKTLQQFIRNANIPGFRKGKVPRQVVLQRYGIRSIKATAIEELIEDSLRQVLEQEKIDALGNAELRSSLEELVEQYEPGKPLTVSLSIDVAPTAKLVNYKGLTAQAEEILYKPERVDEVLESYRERSATRVPVEGRPAKEQDIAVIDFSGQITGDEPKEIPGGSATDFEVELSEGRFIPGFVEGIIGMSVGETKEIETTFPEDYSQADLAGQPAVFTVTLKDLKEKELPELDDDFAQDISEFETLAELRESLEKRFQDEANDKTKANKQEALLEALVANLEVELPETLIRREVDHMITQTAMRFAEQGMDIKQMFTPEMVNMMRERSRPEAIARLRRTMALGEVAKQESITVDAAEVEAKVKEVLDDLEGRSVDRDRLREVIEEDLIRDKIFEFLEANSTVELVPEGTLVKEEPVEMEPTQDDATDTATPSSTEDAVEVGAEPEPALAEEPASPEAAVEVAAEVVAEVDAPATPAEKTSKSTRSKSAKSAAESPESAESEAIAEVEAPEEAAAKPAARKRSTPKSKKDEA
ncbi:trigger factor [Thermoleptolyngbya oregonensis NK1-22]|uniref:Trigger factor n=1 Tax=Thermoleptolyngbya oregonensis NK1-22 TaxID=2547457 RepID=A0AA96Y7K5_9CYAN|nr:trigger factor [Thermoleptolyngbya oregonensis]WOB45171.1 trigger factor [Thermoleptolyngbya oregonensis NK1-22]